MFFDRLLQVLFGQTLLTGLWLLAALLAVGLCFAVLCGLDARSALKQGLLAFGLTLPLAAVLSFPLVTTLFMYREFTLHDAQMTQHALIAYSFGLIGLIMIKVLGNLVCNSAKASSHSARRSLYLESAKPRRLLVLAITITSSFSTTGT